MPVQENKPWWEVAVKARPHADPLEAQREHLRAELARARRACTGDREQRYPRTSFTPAGRSPLAA